jgi:hypothetical protein
MDISTILKDAGFEIVEGYDNVKKAIADVAELPPGEWLCSGYRVFPGGEKCKGCSDCTK